MSYLKVYHGNWESIYPNEHWRVRPWAVPYIFAYNPLPLEYPGIQYILEL